MRVLHWLLVLTVAAAWITSSRIGPAHEYLGYATCVIVIARLFWGRIGNRYARFTQFVRPAAATWQYLRGLAVAYAPRHLGHNPLGGWMVVALLSCVAALGLTGWLYTTDLLWGYGWLASLHAALGYLLLALIALHVVGVLLMSCKHRENLVVAMFSGDKAGAKPDDVI